MHRQENPLNMRPGTYVAILQGGKLALAFAALYTHGCSR
jgi:hypothetical protein